MPSKRLAGTVFQTDPDVGVRIVAADCRQSRSRQRLVPLLQTFIRPLEVKSKDQIRISCVETTARRRMPRPD